MMLTQTLCDLKALETKRYALLRGVAKWCNLSTAKVLTFLGTVVLMGSRDCLGYVITGVGIAS